MTKRKCSAGEEYKNTNGKQTGAKSNGFRMWTKCKFNCKNKFPEKLCYKVFNGFWQMGGANERRNYVMCFISKKEVALRVRTTNDPGSRKKKNSLQYALPKERCWKPNLQGIFPAYPGNNQQDHLFSHKKTDDDGVMGRDERGWHSNYQCISEGHNVCCGISLMSDQTIIVILFHG